MNKLLSQLPVWILVIAILSSCKSDVIYDSYHDIPEGIWHVDSLASFDFEIEDPSLDYDISYHVRYAGDYSFYNLYVTYYLTDSVENILSEELQNLTLFDKKTGEPLGSGVGDLYDREIPIFTKHKFKTAGDYSFKIKQFMRMEQLDGITSFGLKVVKSKEE